MISPPREPPTGRAPKLKSQDFFSRVVSRSDASPGREIPRQFPGRLVCTTSPSGVLLQSRLDLDWSTAAKRAGLRIRSCRCPCLLDELHRWLDHETNPKVAVSSKI